MQYKYSFLIYLIFTSAVELLNDRNNIIYLLFGLQNLWCEKKLEIS